MTAVLVGSTVVIALVALGLATWTFVETHREAKRRKERDRTD